jgi:signal recognition particle receptor subunit beta
MVQINFGQREVNCKVVFYGPAMSGKTTNLEYIHKQSPKETVGDLVSIKTTETDRTLYFDFLPLDLGQVGGMRTKFKLYTVPGQIYYNATRKLVLQGADGVVFVADSRPERMGDNRESLLNLRMNLDELGVNIAKIPLVLQYNMRDMPNAMTFGEMDAQLNPGGALPVYAGVARDGTGVFSCLKEVSRQVIDKLNRDPQDRLRPPTHGAATGPTGAPPPSSGFGSQSPTASGFGKATISAAPPPSSGFASQSPTGSGFGKSPAAAPLPATGFSPSARPTAVAVMTPPVVAPAQRPAAHLAASSSTLMPVMPSSPLPRATVIPSATAPVPPAPASAPVPPASGQAPTPRPSTPRAATTLPPEGGNNLVVATIGVVLVLVGGIVGVYLFFSGH